MEPIFTYMDYRAFLKDKYAELKTTSPVFSFRYFSQRAGFASPNFLKLVMDGKRNLSPESIHKFAVVFKLTGKEQRFFDLLVHYNQAADPRQRQHYYQQLLEFPEHRKVHHLAKEQYAYLAHWYHLAIVELVTLPDFQEDPPWIVERLQHRISVKEARDALETVQVLGLLTRSPEGKLVPAHPSFTTGEEARSLAAFTFHEQVLGLAQDAVSRQEPEEREFAAITMAINERQLAKLKAMLRDFRKLVLNYLTQEEGQPTAVYQFGAHLFALATFRRKKEKIN